MDASADQDENVKKVDYFKSPLETARAVSI